MRLKKRNGGLKYKARSKRRKKELTCYSGQEYGRSRLGRTKNAKSERFVFQKKAIPAVKHGMSD
ncbi:MULTISPECIES: hypothetical protein [Mediterraneibacter]|jgi:hypothetical protein|uniref:hypothetical protein n=1 Tax=Mediterraneibacter TaxID=2316020 RepID=UPI0011C0DE36|nr:MULTISPECIES: hypothetical protein [Mediterraneibacter]